MRGRKPTREEWKVFEQNDLDTREWLVQKCSTTFMQLVNKKTGKVITINKV